MRKFTHSYLGNMLLSSIAIIIGFATIVSELCYGVIDQVFIGWRDTSLCQSSSSSGCLIASGSVKDSATDDGIISMAIFLLLVAIFYVSFKTYKSCKQLRA